MQSFHSCGVDFDRSNRSCRNLDVRRVCCAAKHSTHTQAAKRERAGLAE